MISSDLFIHADYTDGGSQYPKLELPGTDYMPLAREVNLFSCCFDCSTGSSFIPSAS